MFQVNEMVLYGTEGLCKIKEISEQSMMGERKEYYILTPVAESGSTIFVPTDSEVLVSKMRRVMSAEEIYALIKTMPGEESEWIDNENMRKQRYRDILASGDRAALIRMIKAIYFHGEERKKSGKKLHLSDDRFLKDGEKLLYEEFAHVLNIKKDEVLPFIMEQLSVEAKV